jgi:UPF0755 protein
MTDQGLGYGAEPWGQGHPQQGAPQPGYPQQGHPGPYAGSVGYPQQPAAGWGNPQTPQDPYGTGQYPVQQQPPAPVPAPPPVLGPDGIDWEAEAAALEAEEQQPYEPPAEPEPYQAHPHEDDPYADEHPVAHGDDYAEGDGSAEEEYRPFLAAEDDSRSGERRRRAQGRTERKRSGVACLGISVLMVATLSVGGYFGYGLYQKHFGPPADYTGQGTGAVSVIINDGDVGTNIADTLQKDGVVASAKAFVNAYNNNSKAIGIQPGAYTMPERMSAADAVAYLVAKNGGDSLIIPEGFPASKIYPLIDTKLGLPKGATAAAAKADVAQLGLPSYAHGNVEGFLWPARYSITKGMKPVDLLKEMVVTAVSKVDTLGLDSGAGAVKLKSGYQVLIEASILQAEGNNEQDFGKIARVLYNRLNTDDTQGELQLDTTLQYALGSTHFTYAQKNNDSAGGYNTYINKGLPPGPISNPGDAAVQAVLNPTPGTWAYFIALSPSDTRFADTFSQFKVLVQQYCTAHHQGFDATAGACT